jgi:AraC family transcriptional regulator of adaptative response/methylated-DNA-[protein]-cysteine methyltransferase
MTARDYRASGKGQRIAYCSFASPLGKVLIAATSKGLCSVKLGDEVAHLKDCSPRSSARPSWSKATLHELKAKIAAFIDGEANLARLPLDIRGTVFQRRVWDELRRIPRGETRTYPEIARAIGAPAAVRAVGSACGANPVALVVPCHRAVRTDGGLGGYAWGLKRKKKLLALEKKS